MFNMNNMLGNMNMNPMPMGMNNNLMTNFGMDDTAMKIKAIIGPYEKKIDELEKLIKQKDFEILVLKEKLNKYENNKMNMNNNQMMMMDNQIGMVNPMAINNQLNMNNNMNPMNQMMMMNNNANWMMQYNMGDNNNGLLNINNQNPMNDTSQKINIFFNYKNKEYKELSYFDEKTKTICRRFCTKLGIRFKAHRFIHNNKPINSLLTVAESGIIYNSNIFVVENKSNNNSVDEESDSGGECECDGFKYNVNFHFSGCKNIVISPEHSISTLLKKFLFKIGRSDQFGKNDLVFLYNAKKLEYNDKTKLKIFFKGNSAPKIVVNETMDIIGV